MKMSTKSLVITALFTAMAIVINIIESVFPMILPGIKPGLANVFTLAALITEGPVAAFSVAIIRVLIVWLLTGNIFAFFCGVTGGILATTVMSLCYIKYGALFSVPWVSVAGAWGFNLGQIAVAVIFTADMRIALYIVPLLVVGTIAGWGTGFLASYFCKRLERVGICRMMKN